MYRGRVMSFLCLIDDIVMNERHGVEEFKDDPEIQNRFLILSAKSLIDNPESERPDSLSAGKDERVDIVDEFVDFFVADKPLRLLYLGLDIGLQNAVKRSLE